MLNSILKSVSTHVSAVLTHVPGHFPKSPALVTILKCNLWKQPENITSTRGLIFYVSTYKQGHISSTFLYTVNNVFIFLSLNIFFICRDLSFNKLTGQIPDSLEPLNLKILYVTNIQNNNNNNNNPNVVNIKLSCSS